VTLAVVPFPTDIKMITAETPIIMPNIVKKVRSLFAMIPFKASLMAMAKLI